MKKLLLFMAIFMCAFVLNAQIEFITTWKTDNAGTSNSTSITIPTFPGETYNYDVDWNNDGNYNLVDIGKTADVTHDFGAPGTYTIRIRGTFPRIYFNNSGDKDKIISVDQWGTIAWSSMENAFRGCVNLEGNANDTPNLTGVSSLRAMFAGASIFDQNIGNWNVSNVTDFSIMFFGATAFNQDIGQWDTSSATNMQGLFSNAMNFNQDISSWDTTFVTDMAFMFTNAMMFNQDLGNWDVQNVTNMREMFRNATIFNQDISNWNTNNVTTMLRMFAEASNFNQDISSWDTSSVTQMAEMFRDAASFDQNIGVWNVENVNTFSDMFQNATLSTANYDALLTGWNAQNLQPNLSFNAGNSIYCNASAARANIIASDGWTITDGGEDCSTTYFKTTWKTDNPGVSNSTSITIPTTSIGYNYDVDWDNDGTFDDLGVTGNITHDFGSPGTYTIAIRGMFPRIFFNNAGDRRKIISIDQWGTISWTSMGSAFWGCSNLQGNATDAPDLSQVTDMSFMFLQATSFNQDINSWNTSNISNMLGLFADAIAFNQDLSSWDTSNVTNMRGMFLGASSFNGNINSWNTSNVITMESMFAGATSFNQDINNWDVSSVFDMTLMFEAATNYSQSMDLWDTSNVVSMEAMFMNASSFDQKLSTWNVESVAVLQNIFNGVTLSDINYEALLIGWDAQNLQPNLNFSGGNSQYCSQAAADARANMIVSDGWTITDGGPCATLGVEDFELQNLISIYPNPSSHVFAIHGLTEKASVVIVDVTGKQVYKNPNYNIEEIITMDHLQSGMYLIQVKNEKGSTSLKLIKY